MEKKELKVNEEAKKSDGNRVPKYECPKIKTYTKEEILEEVGPAMACSTAPTCPIQV